MKTDTTTLLLKNNITTDPYEEDPDFGLELREEVQERLKKAAELEEKLIPLSVIKRECSEL